MKVRLKNREILKRKNNYKKLKFVLIIRRKIKFYNNPLKFILKNKKLKIKNKLRNKNIKLKRDKNEIAKFKT